MDWIKKNVDKFILALFAVALLAVSGMLFMKTSGFEEGFYAAVANPTPNNQIPAVDTVVIDEARRQLEQPNIWKQRNEPQAPNRGLLFTARPYIVGPRGLEPIETATTWVHSRTKDPIPTEWVLANNFNPLILTGSRFRRRRVLQRDMALQNGPQKRCCSADPEFGRFFYSNNG